MISKNNLEIMGFQDTYPLCFSPFQMSSGPEKPRYCFVSTQPVSVMFYDTLNKVLNVLRFFFKCGIIYFYQPLLILFSNNDMVATDG